MHSVTKYLAGHSDLLLGVLSPGRPTCVRTLDAAARHHRRRCRARSSRTWRLRGLRTLAVRFERAQANALELAQRLAAHPRVSRVRYPGLPSDPATRSRRASTPATAR